LKIEGRARGSVKGSRRRVGGEVEIAVGDTARRLAREIVEPPVPLLARPLFTLARLPTIGLLPPGIRRGYGLPWDDRRERALIVLAAVSRHLLPLLPSALRQWPAARVARAREQRDRRDR